jgi:Kef-type K+ transport system membrane component KefB
VRRTRRPLGAITALVVIALAIVLGLRGPISARADDAGSSVDVATPSDAAAPSDAAVPSAVAAPSDAAVPSDAPAPSDAAVPIAVAAPSDAAVPSAVAAPSDAAVPSAATAAGPSTTGPPAAAPPTPTKPTGNPTGVVLRLVLGLTAIFALAYLGGHRKVVALEQRLGISGVIAAGFPFVALGVIIRQPDIGILTTDVLERMQPILHFGLGWLGFIIGAQLDVRVLDRVPRGTGYLVVVEALGPFLAVAGATAALAAALGLADWRAPEFWRDAIVIGAAGAMTAPRRFRGFAAARWREGRGVDHLLSQLDEIVGVVGLLFVAAYFRPSGAAGWALPGTGWLFITIGLGVAVGILIFTMVRVPQSEGEFLAVVLGSVALGAGLAGYLYLSPIVVCFIAGALVVNFPCDQREAIFKILNHLERPIHLLFLIVAGAAWDVGLAKAWVIVPAFVAARVVGKWTGMAAARSTVGALLPRGYADQRVLVSPLSPLAIALVVSLQGSAGGSPSAWLVTVVIGGAILTEVAVQLTAPPTPRAATASAAETPAVAPTVDELDDDDAPAAGPVYHDDLDEDDRR